MTRRNHYSFLITRTRVTSGGDNHHHHSYDKQHLPVWFFCWSFFSFFLWSCYILFRHSFLEKDWWSTYMRTQIITITIYYYYYYYINIRCTPYWFFLLTWLIFFSFFFWKNNLFFDRWQNASDVVWHDWF